MERWDGCIYLTDGHAAAPAIRPPCKVLWVVTPNGRLGEHLKFGRAVRIE
jgi:predicted metal-dependent peptidase